MENLSERFWKKVRKTNSCWLWTGGTREGYGRIMLNWKRYSTHRISWEIHNGKIPNGLCVLHRCDVPKCVNPKHLWLGTTNDNNKDRARKGRSVGLCSSKNGNSVLKESDMYKIFQMRGKNMPYHKIAKHFNVDTTTIWHIFIGRTWKQFSNQRPYSLNMEGDKKWRSKELVLPS